MADRVSGGLRALWALTVAVTARVARHGQMARASQFAYVAFLASIPFMFVLVSVLGLIASPSDYAELINRTRGTIPDQVADFLDSLLQAASASTSQSAIFLAIGLITGLWLAGNVTGSITDGLDDSLGRAHRPWVNGKVRALGLAAVIAVVFALTTIMAVLGPVVITWVFDQVNASGLGRVTAQLLVAVTAALIFWVFLVLLYRFAPNDDGVRWREVVPGAVVGVAGWLIVANLFRLYVDNFGSYNRAYGSLGVVVIYLVFLYLTGLTILIGGETSAELHQRSRGRKAERRAPSSAFP